MRPHVSMAALAACAAALFVGPALAKPTLTYQINVTVSDNSCVLRSSVSKRNTAILFHVINIGNRHHGFEVWGVRSGMFKPHQEGRFLVNFHHPGSFAFRCVTGRYPHPAVLKRGTFTIRRS